MILLALAIGSARAATCSVHTVDSLADRLADLTCDVIVVSGSYRPAFNDPGGATLVGRAVAIQSDATTGMIIDLPALRVTSVGSFRGSLTIGAGFRVNGATIVNADLAIGASEVGDVSIGGTIGDVAILAMHGATVSLDGTTLSGLSTATAVAVFGSALQANGIHAHDDAAGVIIAAPGLDDPLFPGHAGDPWTVAIADSEFVGDVGSAGPVFADGCVWETSTSCTPTASSLVIRNSAFTGCGSNVPNYYVGGAVSVLGASAEVTGATFDGNRSTLAGGAVFAYLSDLVVTGSRFQDNAVGPNPSGTIVPRGGAIGVFGGSLSLVGTANASVAPDFQRNSSTGPGGAIFATAAAVTLASTTISGCVDCPAEDATVGGGVAVESNVSLDLQDVGLSHLRAGSGGGVYATDSPVTVRGGAIAANKATSADGGGLYAARGVIVLKDLAEFDHNKAIGRGGGAALDDCATTVRGVAFHDDRANRGGGIAVRGGTLDLGASSSFAFEGATVSGGAIDAEKGTNRPYLRLADVHVADAVAPSGGAFAFRDAAADVTAAMIERVTGSGVSGDGSIVDVSLSDLFVVSGPAIDMTADLGPSTLALRATAIGNGGSDGVIGAGVRLIGTAFDVSTTDFEKLRGGDGAALFVGEGSSGRIADVRFLAVNAVGGSASGAVVALDRSGAVAIDRTFTCAGDGPAFAVVSGDGDVALRNVAVYGASREGLIVRPPFGSGAVRVENATFASAPTARVRVEGGSLTMRNAIVQGNGTGVDVVGSAAVDLAYVLFDVPTDTTGGVAIGEGSIGGSARLRADVEAFAPLDTLCTREGLDARALWLAEGSPARDAGDPELRDRYVGNGRSDIGAYGGPLADLPDSDNDGWGDDIDCAIEDPAIHGPGAYDIPGDGIDQDCDGSDAIADTDVDTGGDSGGAMSPFWLTGGGGCATAPGSPLAALLMAIGVGGRRRCRAHVRPRVE